MATPWVFASAIAASMARYAVDCPSFLFAFQVLEAAKRDGSSSISAPGTQPLEPEPKRWSRCRALIALWVRIPWREASAQSRAPSAASSAVKPRCR